MRDETAPVPEPQPNPAGEWRGTLLSLPEGAVPLAPSAKLSGRDRPVRYELLRVRFEPARAWVRGKTFRLEVFVWRNPLVVLRTQCDIAGDVPAAAERVVLKLCSKNLRGPFAGSARSLGPCSQRRFAVLSVACVPPARHFAPCP